MEIYHFWNQIIRQNTYKLKISEKDQSHALLIPQHAKTEMRLQR